MNRRKIFAVIFIFVFVFGLAAIATATGSDRSIVVRLKASEAPNAPVVQTVNLYDASYALVIGIDDYTNGWPRLSNGVGDAKRVATALEKKGFSVTFLKNLKSRELKDAFEKFFVYKGADPDARLFAWFAGHGHTMDGEGYIVPADAPRPSKKGDFKYKSLSLRRFGELARQAESKHALAVFDSCFSGTVFSTGRAMPPPAVTRATTFPVREFISSGDANQQVSDDGRFRKLFIRALNGNEPADANNDGYLTGSELGMFLADRVSNLTKNAQTPRYGKLRDENYDRGDFVFLLASSGAQIDAPAKKPDKTSLSVACNISGASVYLDGRYAGTAPVRNKIVSPGTHTVRVTKDGYDFYKTEVNVRTGRHVTLEAYLDKKKPAAGNLSVDSRPTDATVRILNIGPRYTRGMALAPGDYHVEVSKSGYDTKKQWVTVAAGEDKYITVALAKPHAAEAFRLPSSQSAGKKTTNSLGMEFVYIPPGTFMMGSPSSESGRDNDEKQHRVTLTQGYYMQTTEVTQGQWTQIMGTRPWSGKKYVREGGNYPAVYVSWNDAKEFIQKLKAKTGQNYRLPTEAEWEYACRAGSNSRYCFGDSDASLGSYAWYDDNADDIGEDYAHQVAMKKANAWGLYDMHGNVWEWCADWFGDYPFGSVSDPEGPSSGTYRVYRGGGWISVPRFCRSADRGRFGPGPRDSDLGFRLALPSVR